ncbi:MAG: anhydro-N-acetylmuramic acid kinase [Gammaproteobacteria bacterium]
MPELYIGLMSGTSVDGIDAALVDFGSEHPKLIASHFSPYSPSLRQTILNLCQPGIDEINRLGDVDVVLGKEFGRTVNNLLKKSGVNPSDIHAIGSHGQTIRHHPARRFTLQIADPNIIAVETGITTIADFRRRDMALGGQGAPLVPAFHQSIFFEKNKSRVIVNIGGIANVTFLPANESVIGFDTGPGNTLLDAWTEIHLQQPCDKNGDWAAQGKIHTDLLKKLLSDIYFELSPPKSTGREYFNLEWLRKYLPEKIQAIDVQATLVELTARTIIQSIPFVADELLICGGGAHNSFLMSRIIENAKNMPVSTTEKFGIHPDWVEAMAFAWLAKQTLNKKPGNLPLVTGARKATILGAIYAV